MQSGAQDEQTRDARHRPVHGMADLCGICANESGTIQQLISTNSVGRHYIMVPSQMVNKYNEKIIEYICGPPLVWPIPIRMIYVFISFTSCYVAVTEWLCVTDNPMSTPSRCSELVKIRDEVLHCRRFANFCGRLDVATH